STSRRRQATLDVIGSQVAKLAGAESSLVCLYDTDAGQYVGEAGAGAPQEGLKEYRFGAGEGVHGQAVRNMAPVRSAAIAETIGIEPFLSELGVRSALIVPLLTNEGVLGTITALRRSGRGFTPDDQAPP